MYRVGIYRIEYKVEQDFQRSVALVAVLEFNSRSLRDHCLYVMNECNLEADNSIDDVLGSHRHGCLIHYGARFVTQKDLKRQRFVAFEASYDHETGIIAELPYGCTVVKYGERGKNDPYLRRLVRWCWLAQCYAVGNVRLPMRTCVRSVIGLVA